MRFESLFRGAAWKWAGRRDRRRPGSRDTAGLPGCRAGLTAVWLAGASIALVGLGVLATWAAIEAGSSDNVVGGVLGLLSFGAWLASVVLAIVSLHSRGS